MSDSSDPRGPVSARGPLSSRDPVSTPSASEPVCDVAPLSSPDVLREFFASDPADAPPSSARLVSLNPGASLDGASLDGASLDGASLDAASLEANDPGPASAPPSIQVIPHEPVPLPSPSVQSAAPALSAVAAADEAPLSEPVADEPPASESAQRRVARSEPPVSVRSIQAPARPTRRAGDPAAPGLGGPVPPRRRKPWLLLFAAAGVAGARMCGGDLSEPSASTVPTPPPARKVAANTPFSFNVDGPFTTATLGSATALLGARTGGAAPEPVLLARSGARKPPLTSDIPRIEAGLLVAQEPEAFELTARPAVPGRSWQDAANASDWPAVALTIDALPEPEQRQPGARYARAVAARELGQCQVALGALADLESELPLLGTEIASLRAHCQLEVGPYQEAFRYFSEEQTPESLTLAARAAAKGGDLVEAERTVERALSKIKRQADGRRGLQKEITARILRANILETRGQAKLAARDWLWLATEAATDAQSSSADDTYERLAGVRLGSLQRLERMRAFAREGQLERTLREHARLVSAPGPVPDRVDVSSALAWAYYHSRADYMKAAELFREAAALSADTRAKFSFYEARALTRADQDDRALAAYHELVRRYPGGAYTEQAYYRIARIEYGRGRWESAERAYTEYLDRFARNGGGKYSSASRYELAITRLGARQRTDEAAATLGQLARKERGARRRAILTELEAAALEATQEPAKVAEAVARYRAIIEEQPLSFAALASAARLRALGTSEARVSRGKLPSFDASGLRDTPGLPEKARFLADIGLHTDAERALFDARQAAGERDSATDGQAVCKMYGALDRGFRSYAFAERLLKRDDLGRVPSADNVWAWRCAYPEPYRDIVSAVESRYRLPPSLVHAVMRQESGFRPSVVSPVGAIGLMQLMPNTALRAAEEIMQQPGAPWVPDPRQPTNVLNNLELGGFYLSKLLTMLAGQVPVAVAAYNAGPNAVSSWLAGGEDLPMDVWVARIPYTETRDYVSIVVGNWVAYRYLDSPTELPELALALVPGTRAAPGAY